MIKKECTDIHTDISVVSLVDHVESRGNDVNIDAINNSCAIDSAMSGNDEDDKLLKDTVPEVTRLPNIYAIPEHYSPAEQIKLN